MKRPRTCVTLNFVFEGEGEDREALQAEAEAWLRGRFAGGAPMDEIGMLEIWGTEDAEFWDPSSPNFGALLEREE